MKQVILESLTLLGIFGMGFLMCFL
jgi:hypothetical protein